MVGHLVYASLVGQAKINGRMGLWGGAGDLKIICKIGNHPIKGRVGIFGGQKSSRAGLTLTHVQSSPEKPAISVRPKLTQF